jgi:hypothetical protein
MNELCLLNKFKESDLRTFPYPYLVIHNALDDEVYEKISEEYPSIDFIVSKHKGLYSKEHKKRMREEGGDFLSNARYQLTNEDVLKFKKPSLLRLFTKYHTSEEFYKKVISIFENSIKESVSKEQRKRLFTQRVERRTILPNNQVKLTESTITDCQVGINTPVVNVSSVIGPHVDNHAEIYAGLFYLRKKTDESKGGAFNILKIKDELREYFPQEVKHKKQYPSDFFEVVETVEYSKNTLVLVLCADNSFHSVSPRQETKNERRLINVIAEMGDGECWRK